MDGWPGRAGSRGDMRGHGHRSGSGSSQTAGVRLLAEVGQDGQGQGNPGRSTVQDGLSLQNEESRAKAGEVGGRGLRQEGTEPI